MQRVIIYPAYIDSKKTVAGGRRIPAGKGLFVRCLLRVACRSRSRSARRGWRLLHGAACVARVDRRTPPQPLLRVRAVRRRFLPTRSPPTAIITNPPVCPQQRARRPT